MKRWTARCAPFSPPRSVRPPSAGTVPPTHLDVFTGSQIHKIAGIQKRSCFFLSLSHTHGKTWQSFSVSRLRPCRSKCCCASRRLSLMETNVDTSYRGTRSQLTRCLIKVIYWFIYERLRAAVKWIHAALTLQSGPLLISVWTLMVITCLSVPQLPIRWSTCLWPWSAGGRCP